jgi:hypothetical protein
MNNDKFIAKYNQWRNDWCLFAKDVLKVTLDEEQKKILRAVQTQKMVSVCSGTARGKDFISAVAAMCFMYLTPKFNASGELVENTKIALTAPTDRQVTNIMYPEIMRLWKRAKILPGRAVSSDIRTDYDEWFLTGFKASKDNHEAWSGFHAVNTMFVVTEASGIDESIWSAIEGNLQGNSRLLIVFNPNVTIGYAANSQRSPRFSKFRLDSLSSPNVIEKKSLIPGQVDYEWVKDKVESWCVSISDFEKNEDEGDFQFEINGVTKWYRPNDLFRVKVRGMFPKVSEDSLIPLEWIESAMQRWSHRDESMINNNYGCDVAGMGRDTSVICTRVDDYVYKFEQYIGVDPSAHMQFAGRIKNKLTNKVNSFAFIDTIGEGAGVYSRLFEQEIYNAISCKYSENARDLNDVSGQYEFENMRAYLFWCVRDWLNPANNTGAMLPPDDELLQEATEIKWKFKSNGKVIIEPKDDIKKRIGRSTDKFDSLANTFYPYRNTNDLVTKAYTKALKYL